MYLHRGESYLVRELNLTTLHAIVEPFAGNWYTQPKHETMTTIVEPRRVEWRLGMELAFGEIEVTEQVVGYERKTISGQERIELVPLELPPTTFATEAVWFLPEPYQLAEIDEMPTLLGTLHAAEHALISLLPLWAMCDRWDIGGLSTNIHPQTGRPTVFIYDGHAGGIGIAERGFEVFEGWVADTAALLAGLPVHGRLPLLRPEPEVRQPERHARQGRRADLLAARCRFRRFPFVVRRQPTKEADVKYALLIYGNPDVWAEPLRGRAERDVRGVQRRRRNAWDPRRARARVPSRRRRRSGSGTARR